MVIEMIKGKLLPDFETEMREKGKATIKVGLYRLQEGTVGEKEPYMVDATPTEIIVRYKNRDVTFSIVDLVKDSVKLIDGGEKP